MDLHDDGSKYWYADAWSASRARRLSRRRVKEGDTAIRKSRLAAAHLLALSLEGPSP